MVGAARVCHPVGHGRGGAGVNKLKQSGWDYGPHSPNHGADGGDCCGRGRAPEEA
jgi:hypothetical protein